MTTTNDPNAANGKRTHYETEAVLLVQNQWMRLICALLAIGFIGLAVASGVAWRKASHARLVIVERSASGSLDPIKYVDAADFRPGAKDIEYFAYHFVVDYFSRSRYSIASDYPTSLKFLADPLMREKLTEETRTHWIEEFQKSADPEVRIVITKIRLGAMNAVPARMSLDFEKHFLQDGRERSDLTERWTVDLAYTLLPESEIANDSIPVNPIGLSIGEMREFQGFRQ